MLSGLRSWLGFAGTITNTMTLTGTMLETGSQPWQPPPGTETSNSMMDDSLARKAEETMNQIATDFCLWLRQLPGEDKTINNISEVHVRLGN